MDLRDASVQFYKSHAIDVTWLPKLIARGKVFFFFGNSKTISRNCCLFDVCCSIESIEGKECLINAHRIGCVDAVTVIVSLRDQSRIPGYIYPDIKVPIFMHPGDRWKKKKKK